MPTWLNILFGIIAAVCAVAGLIISIINVNKNKDLNNEIKSINSIIEVKKQISQLSILLKVMRTLK